LPRRCIFILGGARSGKSQFAQELAGKLGKNVLFVATGQPLDEEMKARITQHKKDRPKNWHTLEAPSNLRKLIEQQTNDLEVVIIDCLTLLVSNLLGNKLDYSKAEKQVMAEIRELIACIDKFHANFIIVSNEVGLDLVPETKLGRLYRDLLGKANQLIAQRADEVYLMIAGIPLKIKGRD
jgi:adenosylcobinamide kinase/adenosylcobinamide-phosphate guanylyltransferase